MILQVNGEYPDQTCANVVNCCKQMLLITVYLYDFSECDLDQLEHRNMATSHLICHVARVIDGLLSFRSLPKFYYTNYRNRVRCCSFLFSLLLFFKTMVPWLQKTRTDIHGTDQTMCRLFY